MKRADIINQIEQELIDDQNIYSEEARAMLLEEGALSPEEEAFMKGYDEAY